MIAAGWRVACRRRDRHRTGRRFYRGCRGRRVGLDGAWDVLRFSVGACSLIVGSVLSFSRILLPPSIPVGVGLPTMRSVRRCSDWMCRRHRGQARSHRKMSPIIKPANTPPPHPATDSALQTRPRSPLPCVPTVPTVNGRGSPRSSDRSGCGFALCRR